MIPNWSKAPEWADKHGFASDNSHAVWLNNEQYCYVDERQYGRVFSFAGREGWCIEEIKHITLRPSLKEWGGEGYPTIGTFCEYQNTESGIWSGCEIVATRNNAWVVVGDDYSTDFVTLKSLRPRRTRAQISAEERAAAIEEMWATYWKPEPQTAKEALGLLWDAGWRKQVEP